MKKLVSTLPRSAFRKNVKETDFTTKAVPAFTLLISVLIAGILLALGYAIYNIVSKDIILSSSGRESQFAFYAADTGIECALYWDRRHDAFSASSTITDITCGSATTTLTRVSDVNTLTTTFSFSLDGPITNPCADVKVVRNEDPTQTTVESLGHNTCVVTNPHRIERAIRARY